MMKRFVEKIEEQQMQNIPFHIQMRSLSLRLEQIFIIPSPTNDLQFLRPGKHRLLQIQFPTGNNGEAYLNHAAAPVALAQKHHIGPDSRKFPVVHTNSHQSLHHQHQLPDYDQRQKMCLLPPPFDHIHDLQVSKMYLKKITRTSS